MKFIKNLSVYLLSFIFLVSLFSFSASAASSATISFSSKTITVGDSVTVTVTVNPGVAMTALSYNINYDENLLTFVSSDYADGGAGILNVAESPSNKTSVSYSMVFRAIATGTATVKVENCLYAAQFTEGVGAEERSFGGASAAITVKDPALSNNANLKSLSISGVKLSPSFSQKRTSYTAKVLYETTQVNVTANVADNSAKVVSVTGNTNLKVGNNNVVVTVQAADGTQKKYTIAVTRLKEGEQLTTDTPEQPEEPEVDVTKLQVEIAGTTYVIATEIPEANILKGFKLSTETYNETQVPVLVDEDGNYTLYYLKSADSENLVPYTYNKELKSFEKLKFIILAENVYIFENIPSEYAIPQNLYTSNLKVSDFSVECLSSNDPDLNDMHYVYCYMGGNYALYRYDSLENTIQRFPDLKLQKIDEVIKNDNLVSRFMSLSANGKIIIISLLIAVLGALALIVILVIYLIKKFSKKDTDILLESFEEDFEEVTEQEEVKTEE